MGSYFTAGAQILQGLEARKAAKQEGGDLRKQGAIAVQEAEAEGDRQAKINDRFEQRQRLSFLKSGVSLGGSPLDVLAETRETGRKEVEAVRASGQARGALLRSKGQITERGGRSALLGSFGQASANIKRGFDTQTGGVFNKKASSSLGGGQ